MVSFLKHQQIHMYIHTYVYKRRCTIFGFIASQNRASNGKVNRLNEYTHTYTTHVYYLVCICFY